MNRGVLWGGLAALGLGGLAVVVLSSGGEGPTPGPDPRPGGGWYDRTAPGRIRELAGPVEEVTGWSGIVDFLLAVAAGESAGNQTACAGLRGATLSDHCPGNNARGWFGMRPSSAYAHEYKPLRDTAPDLIRSSAPWSVATAIWYAYRMRNYGRTGHTIDWLAVRRGWALPRLVADVDETADVKGYAPGERSADVRRRMERALRVADLPETFMWQRAFPPGFIWPGFAQILELVGATYPEATA